MVTITALEPLRQQLHEWRMAGERIAFVATMGNLHQGHLQLVREARQVADRVVCSIFVNPMQFGPDEDFAHYPRTLEVDQQLLQSEATDLLFHPPIDVIYPAGTAETTSVQVPVVSEGLCDDFRPGHFTGVATVVARLFLMVQPDIALFGRKDYQQLAVLKKMVSDLCFPIQIIAVETVREADGLALSSRNQYLAEAERHSAPLLYQTLNQLAEAVRDGNIDFSELEQRAIETLQQAGFRPDYVQVRQVDDLSPAHPDLPRWVVLAAAYLGKARLIDNVTI
ncbi:MAG: pantoate--beta-alanine ligase [Gammaproteobacteria bacterium]